MRSRMLLIALTSVGAFALLVGSSFASSGNEGSGGNNVVCGGVKTHAALVALAKGAPDLCGHTDVARIWRTFGITPQVAKTMTSGVVCGSGGWISSGRQHSPNRSADVRRGGFYTRPLSVWGSGVCYDAWVGTLEDGTQVAVLKGCGNAEMRRGHRPTPNSTPAPNKAPVYVIKVAVNVFDQVIPTPTGTFQFHAVINGKNSYPVYNHPPRQLVGYCQVGSRVSMTEMTPHSVEQWKLISPAKAFQSQLCTRAGAVFVYKNQETNTTTPPASTPITGSICKTVTSGGFDGLKLTFHVTITHPHGVSGWVGDEQVAVGGCAPIGPNGTTQTLFTGDVVQVCEDQASAGSKGLTIGGNGQWCQTQTVGSANITFQFVDSPVPAPQTPSSSPPSPAPKDGTSGPGSGTSGSAGGSGSGGSPGAGSGSVCRDPNTGNIVSGTPDQFGYCS